MNEKDLYQQKLQAQLNEWQADVDKMKAKLGGASVGAKLELNQEINLLEEKLAEGRKQLEEFSTATEENWETFKENLDSGWDEIANAFTSALGKF